MIRGNPALMHICDPVTPRINVGGTLMDIIVDPKMMLEYQVRKPRSKKRRIQKKWAKRINNWKFEPDPNCQIMALAGIVRMHPSTLQHIQARALETMKRTPSSMVGEKFNCRYYH